MTTAAGGRAIILRGGTVVDTRDGSVSRGVDVVISAGRISGIVPPQSSSSEAGDVVDVAGKYLVPGFIETHAHVLEEKEWRGALDLMLLSGITGFRQMSGSPQLLRKRKAGTLEMPAHAPAVLAMPGTVLTPINAGTNAVALATVRAQHAAGADFIKVGVVSPSVFFDAQAEADRLGIPILGHLPVGIDVRAVARGGIRSIEHLGPGLGILAACSTEEDSLIPALLAQPARLKGPPIRLPGMERLVMPLIRRRIVNPALGQGPTAVELLERAVRTFSDERARALAADFVASSTWQCVTLIRQCTSLCSDAPRFRNDPNLRFVSPPTRSLWNSMSGKYDALPTPTRKAFYEAYELELRLTKIFDEEGVPLLAGSDCGGSIWEVPGYALHQEFDELARAGLSPLRVLQTTTLDAARFLGVGETAGTIQVGKAADIVILDGNPVESVSNLHAIAGVVRCGHHVSARDLSAIRDAFADRRFAA